MSILGKLALAVFELPVESLAFHGLLVYESWRAADLLNEVTGESQRELKKKMLIEKMTKLGCASLQQSEGDQ